MSRHSLRPAPGRGDLYEIAIGWDRGLASFFVIVFGCPDDARYERCELVPLVWAGKSPGELPTPETAIAVAAPYAVLPEGLAAQLGADRDAEGTGVNGLPPSPALAALWTKARNRQ